MKALVVALLVCTASAYKTGVPNPDESGKYFQGDMRLMPWQLPATRNGLIDTTYRWPVAGAIPYYIDLEGFSAFEITEIERAANEFAIKSPCVAFNRILSTSGVGDYIHVKNQTAGCFSHVGRTGGAQELGLTTYGINRYGSIIHEFLHALGFHHQHSTFDRDSYVKIIWENIEEGFEHNFDKYDEATVTQFTEMYDYYSIMHYSAYAFTSNGKPTIKPLQEIGYKIGQRDGFSDTDIAKLNTMYGCHIPA